MSAEEIAELTAEVNRLERDEARRVARLVLECRASLRDALAAVRMADHVAQPPPEHPAPRRRSRLAQLFTGLHQRHVGQ
ncbi:MAG: hypothetical protein RLZZ387_3603 [Chloroflexota bacterium]|jgi:hypothetical protein